MNEFHVLTVLAPIDKDDIERRQRASLRTPMIAKWSADVPTGYIHAYDAVEYIKRRWGSAISRDKLEALARMDDCPRPLMLHDGMIDGKASMEAFYAFEEIDLWVYRTLSGVPSNWRDTRGQISTMPVHVVKARPAHVSMKRKSERKSERMIKQPGENDAKGAGNEGSRGEEDGRRRDETSRSEGPDEIDRVGDRS